MCAYHQLNKAKSAELFVSKTSETAKTCPMINSLKASALAVL